MADRTTRGDEQRKEEDEGLAGQPVRPGPAPAAGSQPGQTTREKGAEPADDAAEGEDEDEDAAGP